MRKTEARLISAVFCLILLAGGIFLLLSPKESYSEPERRALAEAPLWSERSVLSGRFFTELDRWTADHFPCRDLFRSAKAIWQLRIMREPENNGLVRVDGSIMKLEKQVNEASLDYASERFRAVYDLGLEESSCSLYCALIPDKSHFLRDMGFPVMDLERMESIFEQSLPGAKPIVLEGLLSLEDYYLTDTHWRQERILPVARQLLEAMGRDPALLSEEEPELRDCGSFLGVYSGQSALRPKPEEIRCLTGEWMEACEVVDCETGNRISMYDPEHCDPRDRYTLFLGGAKGLLRIENPRVENTKELVVFRDSFGSSIAPLLCAGYRTVTLVDLRYVHPRILPRYLRFTDQDVLFLYSATLLNQSQGLR